MDSTLLKSKGVPLSIEAPEASSNILRTPSVGASAYRSGQTESNLKTTSCFLPGILAQKSAKVPPAVHQQRIRNRIVKSLPRSMAILIPAGAAEGIFSYGGDKGRRRGRNGLASIKCMT